MAEPALIVKVDPAPSAWRGGAAKRLCNWLAALLTLPVVASYRLSVILAPRERDRVFQGYSQFMSLWPGFTGNFLRRAFYCAPLKRCAPDCAIVVVGVLATPVVQSEGHVIVCAMAMNEHA